MRKKNQKSFFTTKLARRKERIGTIAKHELEKYMKKSTNAHILFQT